MRKIIVIAGTTATGKTETAIKLAKKINGEIISADSRQIYKGMNIGTNKPDASQLRQIKHHLIDIVEPNRYFSAGEFSSAAKEVIKDILTEHKTPIVVGGTGFYIKSLTEGLIESYKSDLLREKLIQSKNKYGINYLVKRLQRLDPQKASVIDLKNPVRVIRALEIRILSGRRFSDLISDTDKPEYQFLFFGLSMDRQKLYEKINKRVDCMIEKGLIEETKFLLEKYRHESKIIFSTIGYKEISDYLSGRCDLDTAVEMIKKNTRNYAKKQITWFSKVKKIKWIDADDTPVTKILNYIRESGIIKNCD